MAEEVKKQAEAETPATPPPAVEVPKAESEEKTVSPPSAEEKPEESKALVVVESKLGCYLISLLFYIYSLNFQH